MLPKDVVSLNFFLKLIAGFGCQSGAVMFNQRPSRRFCVAQ